MKPIFIFLLSLIMHSYVLSQEITYCYNECESVTQYKSLIDCIRHGISANDQVLNILSEIQKKRSYSKLPDNFKILACSGFNNCAATTDENGSPIIIYDPTYLRLSPKNLSARNTKSLPKKKNWWAYAIIAHELGHFTNLDLHKDGNYSKTDKRREMELGADYFAGVILGMLGCSSDEITNLCNNFINEACKFHPTRTERKIAMLEGLYSITGDSHVGKETDEEIAWERTKKLNTYSDYEVFLDKYPLSPYAKIARAKIEYYHTNIKTNHYEDNYAEEENIFILYNHDDIIYKEEEVEKPAFFPTCKKKIAANYSGYCEGIDLNEFMKREVEFPSIALENGVKCIWVDVSFIIEKDGSISQIKVDDKAPLMIKRGGSDKKRNELVDMYQLFDKEAKRFVENMPNWIPAEKNLVPVRTLYQIRIKFDNKPIPSDMKIHKRKMVDEMPRFPGCENISDKNERKICSTKKMLEFIYSNIKYPNIARENGVEGTTIIRFVIEKNGSISEISIVKDIGALCGHEALRIVNLLDNGKKWIPGKKGGIPVRAYVWLPIKFKLD